MSRLSYKHLLGAAFALMAATSSGAALAKDFVVGLSWDTKDTLVQAWEDYFQSESKTMGDAAGVHFKWIINVANNDPTQQAANIEDLINQGVNVIVARAKDGTAIGASVRAAKEAGIPFVTFDRESTNVKPTAHVGADSYAHAKLAATALVEELKAKNVHGKCIELLGSQVDTNAVNFSKAWNDVTKSSGVVDNLMQVPTEWNPELFLSGTTNAFRAHPDANCMFVASDFALSAVQSALEKIGRWKPQSDPAHVYIASVGLMPTAVKAMEGGYHDVAALWDTWGHARELDRVLIAIAQGKDPGCGDKGCLVNGRIGTPQTIDTMENIWSRKYADK
jgi:ribose transport system substrate-binding protein